MFEIKLKTFSVFCTANPTVNGLGSVAVEPTPANTW